MLKLKIKNHTGLFLYLAIFFSFFLGRFGVWYNFFFPFYHGDSIAYLSTVFSFKNLTFPSFDFIGPGYPLFLYVSSYAFDLLPLSAVVLVQQFFTLIAVLFFVNSFKKKLFLFVVISVSMCFYILNDSLIGWEMGVYPDLIISNLIIIFLGLIYRWFDMQKTISLIFLGIVSVLLIYIRSSNLFIIPVLFLFSVFLIFLKQRKEALLLFIIIFIGLFALSSYNYFFSNGNKFSFITYDRNDRYFLGNESEIDKEIISQILQQLPKNTNLYNRFFSKNIDTVTSAINSTRTGIYAKEIQGDNRFLLCSEGGKYLTECYEIENNWQKLYSTKDLVDNINNYNLLKKDLNLKLKVFFGMLTNFYRLGATTYYGVIDMAHTSILQKKNDHVNKMIGFNSKEFSKFAFKNYYNVNETITDFNLRKQKLYSNVVFKVYDKYCNVINNKLLKSKFTFYILMLLLVLNFFIALIQFKNPISKLVIFTTLSYLAFNLLFTLVSNPLSRYAFNVEFIYFLIIPFTLILTYNYFYDKQ